MPNPRAGDANERPLEELVQTVSQQAVVLARKEVDLARMELAAKARQAAAGAGMVGGGALMGVLAAGTGTAALVLLLSGRTRPSAAALGVTGLYAAGGAALAQQGIARLRAAAPPVPEQTVESVRSLKKKRANPKGRDAPSRKRSASTRVERTTPSRRSGEHQRR
jgi:Putative Actinobacterial Holin-X, holin superfamily III